MLLYAVFLQKKKKMKHCVFFPPQACLPFIPGAAATRGRLSLFEPEDCEEEVGVGGDVAPRMAAPLDAWMLKWDLLFMNLFTVVPVVKENVAFFLFVFFVLSFSCVALNICRSSKKHFTRSAAGSRDSVQDGGLEKFPAVCRFVPAHSPQTPPSPHCPLGFS